MLSEYVHRTMAITIRQSENEATVKQEANRNRWTYTTVGFLRTYQGTASQVIRVTMKELDNLKKIMSDTNKNNVKYFCDYWQLLITKL